MKDYFYGEFLEVTGYDCFSHDLSFRCSKCSNSLEHITKFNALNLIIKGSKTIKDCLPKLM